MAKLGGERHSVQNPLIRYACEIGWEYIKPEEALRLRNGETGLLFKEVFKDQISKLNSEFIDNGIIDELIKKYKKDNNKGKYPIYYFNGCTTLVKLICK